MEYTCGEERVCSRTLSHHGAECHLLHSLATRRRESRRSQILGSAVFATQGAGTMPSADANRLTKPSRELFKETAIFIFNVLPTGHMNLMTKVREA